MLSLSSRPLNAACTSKLPADDLRKAGRRRLALIKIIKALFDALRQTA